ncbi:hypothetical protein EDC14_1001279 [Hydrogenispora ethanolica]|uniref:Uncharacterized protein n=1 Tax=Hydrogenispora ethanolica TaxID=1082276 RepID=A0A4R1SCH4_HYDET|nr:hypothetical protein [Hydrogenispora ethanolica]TCL76994.1 hypothetical protein EDC14_1001279 [Hydrogenispora ethanolica]
MNRTNHLKAYGWTALASGAAGFIVGMTALLTTFYRPGMLRVLLASILAGVIIGSFSQAVCSGLANRIHHRPLLLWGLVLVIIGAGTLGATWCIGELPPGKVAILVAVAELLGLSIAYANYRHFVVINQKLRQKQEQLGNGPAAKNLTKDRK